ncbi:MAG: tetratricopeptide repeat-containing sensor histidine kinase [Bacteroidales bacterium]|nr:tetratricopeptide repeat-containing sensor histidine kinase [Bacteroidales bacterium]
MNLYKKISILILLILYSVCTQGQESLFPSSNEYPSFTPFAEDYITMYLEKSRDCLNNGDLEGLQSNIDILKDLNIDGDPRVSSLIQNHSGILEFYKGNMAEALQYYLSALSYYNTSDELDGRHALMNNIAIIFGEIEDYESSMKYLQKALAYTPTEEILNRSIYMLNLAEMKALSGNYSQGIMIATELLDLFGQGGIEFSEVAVYGILIGCYKNLGDTISAEKWINDGLKIISPETTYLDLQSFYSNVVEYFFSRKAYSEVLEYGKLIYPPPDSSFIYDLDNTINYMATAARETGDLNFARVIDKKANDLEYSRAALNKNNIINPLIIQYSYNRDIMDKDLLDQELQENNAREQIQRRFLRNLIIIIILMSIGAILLLRTKKIRDRYQENLRVKNDKLQTINEELVKNNLNLEKENRVLDTLISIFAHDLINPFQAILGFSQLMLNDHERLEEENFLEYSGILSDTSFQLNQLLVNLNSMAIVQDNAIQPEKESFRILPVVLRICSLFRSATLNKEIKLNTDKLNDVEIRINLNIFEAVLRNIISNAIKFSNLKSEIELSCITEKGKAILKVTDHGIGMPESIRTKLLAKGYPESRTGTSNERGSGIGMAICIELMEMTEGKLDIISKENKGSTIELTLPVHNV